MPIRTIDRQTQEPLGRAKKKSATVSCVKKGTQKGEVKMARRAKEAEADAEAKIRRKEADAEADADAEARLRRKDSDAEADADADAEAAAMRRVSAKDADAESDESEEAEDEEPEADEEEYKRFRRFMARYSKESACKAEGKENPPGGEQADPKYTIGRSDGAASPVHAKSMKEFQMMQKAIKENVGIEGFEKVDAEAKKGNLSFKSMREEQLSKK
jgi:hypothetical protein